MSDLVEKLKATIEEAEGVEAALSALRKDIHQLRHEFSVLWEVAYEGLARGDAFYEVVKRRTGKDRASVEPFFQQIAVDATPETKILSKRLAPVQRKGSSS